MIEQEVEEINKYVGRHSKTMPWFVKSIVSHPKRVLDYLFKHRLNTPELLTVTSNSFEIMVNELSKHALEKADYVINPNLNNFSRFDFNEASRIIISGKKATTNSIKDIKKLIK